MLKVGFLASVLPAAFVAAACMSEARLDAGAATPGEQKSTEREVVVNAETASVELVVGQVLAIRRPAGTRTWRATGADAVLERMSPRGDDPAGPEGWRFRARAAGNGEMTVSGHAVPACPNPPRCPPGPSPIRFTLRVQVTK